MKKIKATCEQLDPLTEKCIPGTQRLIGYFDTEDAASFAAENARQQRETVALYNTPSQPEEDMSAFEMAEIQGYWDDIDENLF